MYWFKKKDLQSNLCTPKTITLGAPILWSLLTGGRNSKVALCYTIENGTQKWCSLYEGGRWILTGLSIMWIWRFTSDKNLALKMVHGNIYLRGWVQTYVWNCTYWKIRQKYTINLFHIIVGFFVRLHLKHIF